MVWHLLKSYEANTSQREWEKSAYVTCSRNKENKEKETLVKTSIFLGVCGSGEITDDKELAWLSAATA